MEIKCFYKIENNIEFVWRIRQIEDTPHRLGGSIAEHFVCNVKHYVRSIVKSENDLRNRNLLNGYVKIYNTESCENDIIYDDVIGLLRKDEKFPEIYAFRHILGLNKICRVNFESTIEIKTARNLFQKSVNIDREIGDKIIQIGFEHYQRLGAITDYFSEPKLNTIEEFRPTIELQSVSLYGDVNNEEVTYYFRPSWDEEHGLYIRFNFKTMTGENDN